MPRPRPYPIPAPTSYQACFYQYENFQGNKICLHPGQSIANLRDYGFDDTISSAIIPPGFTVEVYEYADFYGYSVELRGAIYDLRDYNYIWDDSISAIDYVQY
ncbi:MAG TPA: peptidase inhibitor family I36 protein [Bacteriovoracaceae bacterium]|nr:peptidase inhibitor family I36 protein [Bacteriovoracaceae bacterium]